MTDKAAVSGSVLQFVAAISLSQSDWWDWLSTLVFLLLPWVLSATNHHSFTLTIKNVAMLQWCNASCDLLLYFILCNDTNDCFLCWNIRKVSALETLYLSIFQPLLRTKEPSRDEENTICTICYNKTSTTIAITNHTSRLVFLIKGSECVTQGGLWSRTNPRSYLFYWRQSSPVRDIISNPLQVLSQLVLRQGLQRYQGI